MEERGKPEGRYEQVARGPGDLKSLRRFRKEHVERTLRMVGNDEEKAAEALGITTAQLRQWKRKLGITECSSVPESGQDETERSPHPDPGPQI